MSKMSEGRVCRFARHSRLLGRSGVLPENATLSTRCGSCLVPRMCPRGTRGSSVRDVVPQHVHGIRFPGQSCIHRI